MLLGYRNIILTYKKADHHLEKITTSHIKVNYNSITALALYNSGKLSWIAFKYRLSVSRKTSFSPTEIFGKTAKTRSISS